MTPFLTVVFGILFGIAGTCLAILWFSAESTYSAAVLPGQRWKVKGLGIITIKETLTGGKYYPRYGNGTNVAYITEHGKLGHCSRHAITSHGVLVKQMANVAFVSSNYDTGDSKPKTYNRYGRIVSNDNKDTVDAEFCDDNVSSSNVYQLVPRRRIK
tara:strand:+ start:1851 stop:2321 length:471 start_codon:yes stop_codon:yes gene_type:complete